MTEPIRDDVTDAEQMDWLEAENKRLRTALSEAADALMAVAGKVEDRGSQRFILAAHSTALRSCAERKQDE